MKKFGLTVSKVTACIVAASSIALMAIPSASGIKVSNYSTTGLTKISFWNSFTGSDATELKALVKQFNSQNKGKYEVDMNIMSSDAYTQKLPISLATGTGPNIMAIGPNDVITYSKKGTIWSIDDIFSKTGLKKSNFETTAINFSTVNNKLYGLPLEVFSNYLFWNKTLFKQAGLNPNTPPKTLQQLVTYAEKLTVSSKNQYGFAMPVKGAPAFYVPFIRGNGGEAVSNNKSVFNTAANINTVKMLKELADHKVSPTSASGVDTDNLMLSGKMGMYINGPWLIPGLKSHNINYGVTTVPAGSKGTSAVLDGVIYCISKVTTGAQKAGAYQYLKFWNSTSTSKAWSLNGGFPSYLKTVESDPQIKSNKDIIAMSDCIKKGVARTWLVGVNNGGKIDSDVLFPIIEELQNGTSAEEAVKSASDQINRLVSLAS